MRLLMGFSLWKFTLPLLDLTQLSSDAHCILPRGFPAWKLRDFRPPTSLYARLSPFTAEPNVTWWHSRRNLAFS